MGMSQLDYEKHTLELAKTLRIDLAEAQKTIASSVLEGTMPKPTDTMMIIPPYMVIQALTEQPFGCGKRALRAKRGLICQRRRILLGLNKPRKLRNR
jgi:hypothetical protein